MFKVRFLTIFLCISISSLTHANPVKNIEEIDFNTIETSLAAMKLLPKLPDELIESISALVTDDMALIESEVDKSRVSWYQAKPIVDEIMSTIKPLPKKVYIPIRGLPWKYENGRYYIRELKRKFKRGLMLDRYNEHGLISTSHRLAINLKEDSLIKTEKVCKDKACKEHMYISEESLPEGHNFKELIKHINTYKHKIPAIPYFLMATVDLDNVIKTNRIPSMFGYYLDGTISNLSVLIKE